jgi:hypothetical protein
MIGRIAIALLVIVFEPAGASAGSAFFEKYFPQSGNGSDCYVRGYDAAHMTAHPRQRVTYFAIDHEGDEPADPRGPEGFVVNFSFTLKGVNDDFVGVASCTGGAIKADCVVDNNAGSFSLAPAGEKIMLAVGSHLQVQGQSSNSNSPDLARDGDDRVFLLSPSPKHACKVVGAG